MAQTKDENIGCTVGIIGILIIGAIGYYFVFTSDNELLANKCDVPKERWKKHLGGRGDSQQQPSNVFDRGVQLPDSDIR